MFILKFINEEDDLSVKEFESLSEVKNFIKDNNIDKVWHQMEEIKKVIPNFKED